MPSGGCCFIDDICIMMMMMMTDDTEYGNSDKDNGMTNNKMSRGMMIMVMINFMTSPKCVAV